MDNSIKEAYNKGIPFFRLFSWPLCYESIKNKTKLWLMVSPMFTLFYFNLRYNKNKNSIKEIFKYKKSLFYINLGIFMIGSTISTWETIILCDEW